MGNHRFRLLDIMPNSWFYKLKDMSSSRTRRSKPTIKCNHHPKPGEPTTPKLLPSPHPPPLPQTNPPFIPKRPSHYYPRLPPPTVKLSNCKASDTQIPIDPTRKSKRKSRTKPNISVCRSESMTGEYYTTTTTTTTTTTITSSPSDIIIEVEEQSPRLQLPPIITTPREISKPTSKKSPTGLHRLRMRTSSPRLANKKVQAQKSCRTSTATTMQRMKRLTESLAVEKLSSDPQRDFRDSMVEMIVENNIRDSNDLEELLACYLALNSDEYHDVIVNVFEQIWFDLIGKK